MSEYSRFSNSNIAAGPGTREGASGSLANKSYEQNGLFADPVFWTRISKR